MELVMRNLMELVMRNCCYLFWSLLDGSGCFAQCAVHILGADLQWIWLCALNEILLVTRQSNTPSNFVPDFNLKDRTGADEHCALIGGNICEMGCVKITRRQIYLWPSPCTGLFNKHSSVSLVFTPQLWPGGRKELEMQLCGGRQTQDNVNPCCWLD